MARVSGAAGNAAAGMARNEAAYVAELQRRVGRDDALAVLVAEDHVGREGALGGVGVLLPANAKAPGSEEK